jgi:hypothetical protein
MASHYRNYQRSTESRRMGRPAPVRDSHDIDSEGGLSHILITGHPDTARGSPKWLVQHFDVSDTETPSSEHTFSDGFSMLEHVGKMANVPEFREEDSTKERQ